MSSNKECERRRVQGYLKPSVERTFRGYAKSNGMSKSECVNLAVKEFIKRIPEHERIRLNQIAGE